MTTKTVTEIASIFRVTPRAVRLWLDAGMPAVKRAGRGEQAESLIDLEVATRWYFEVNAARLELDRERAALAREQLQTVALRNAERRENLVGIGEAARQFSSAIQFAERTLLAVPARVAPAISKTSDPAVIEALLRSEIHARLQELADYKGETGGAGKRAKASCVR